MNATVTAGLRCAPGQVPGRVDHDHDDQPEHQGHADHAQGSGVLGLGDDRPTAREDQCEDADSLGAPARRRRLGRSLTDASATGGGSLEYFLDCFERTRDKAEVAVCPAGLSLDDAGIDQLLQMVADCALGVTKSRLDLADADGFSVGGQEHVDYPQPMPIGKRFQDRLQIRCPLLLEEFAPAKGVQQSITGRSPIPNDVTSFIDEDQ